MGSAGATALNRVHTRACAPRTGAWPTHPAPPHTSHRCMRARGPAPPRYPLSFAACSGQKEVVAHLKRHGASVNGDRDAQ